MPKSAKKTPKKRPQGDAETVKDTVSDDSNVDEEVDGEDEGNQKPSFLALDDLVFKESQGLYPEDFKIITQIFTDPQAIKIMIEAFQDFDDHEVLRTNTGMILSMVDKGDLTVETFRKVHRPLPLASGHVDSSPSAKDVSITFEALTKLSEKDIRKEFETANGGSPHTQKWGVEHQKCFERLYDRAMLGTGISAADSFVLNLDGVAYRNGTISVKGDQYSSLVVGAGNSGQYFASKISLTTDRSMVLTRQRPFHQVILEILWLSFHSMMC